MNVLITGVGGFIGSHLTERLISEGYHVIGVDGFTDYYPRQMKERNVANLRGHERFTLIEGDLLDLDLAGLLQGELSSGVGADIELVFHFAAQPGVRASWGQNFEVYTRNNVLATQRLLEAAREVPLKKFIYASSSSVYGDAESFPTPEDVTPRPISPYGVTKLAGEHLCLLYWRHYGVPVVSLRYFTVYGPRQRPDMAFHRFIRAMLEGCNIVVYGDGEQTRDFTYVDDAVRGTVQAVETTVGGEVFNIGSGSPVTINEVIRALEDILGQRARVRHVEPRRGDVRHTLADIRRGVAALGYAPRLALTDGLRAQVAWLIANLEPVQPTVGSQSDS